MARDGGTPSLTATSTVLVTIARNLNAPEWTLSAYTVNITETQDLGTPIAALGTRDDDVEVRSKNVDLNWLLKLSCFSALKFNLIFEIGWILIQILTLHKWKYFLKVVRDFLEDKKSIPIFVKYRIFSIHSSDVYM